MHYFTKNRIKNWLLIFLLITNVTTISSILFHRSKFKEQISKDTHYRIKKFIENDLKFTPEQNERYLAAKKDLDAQRPLMYTRFDQHRIAIYKELAQPQIDSVKIDSLTLLMGPHFAQMNKLSIKKYYFLVFTSYCKCSIIIVWSPREQNREVNRMENCPYYDHEAGTPPCIWGNWLYFHH